MTTPDSTARSDSAGLTDDMILVPILLRADGITARIHFPANLTEAEADKISRVLKAYATPKDETPNTKDSSHG